MKPGEYNFNIYQGATLTKTFMVTGLDLSDYDMVRMQIRAKPTSKNVIWNSEVDGGLTFESDRIVLNIPASKTAEFSFNTAGYDIELVKDQTEDVVDKILAGAITLTKEYTKVIPISV